MPTAREALLNAALSALTDQSWSAVRMVDVASAGGVSRQTLYNEFGSKDGLARALVRREADLYLYGVERLLAEPADAVDRLVSVAEWTVSEARSRPLLRALLTDGWTERHPAPRPLRPAAPPGARPPSGARTPGRPPRRSWWRRYGTGPWPRWIRAGRTAGAVRTSSGATSRVRIRCACRRGGCSGRASNRRGRSRRVPSRDVRRSTADRSGPGPISPGPRTAAPSHCPVPPSPLSVRRTSPPSWPSAASWPCVSLSRMSSRPTRSPSGAWCARPSPGRSRRSVLRRPRELEADDPDDDQ